MNRIQSHYKIQLLEEIECPVCMGNGVIMGPLPEQKTETCIECGGEGYTIRKVTQISLKELKKYLQE